MQDKMSITVLDKLIIKLSDEGSIILTTGENNL